MKRLTTDEIRQSYIDFFKSKGHTECPSDSLIPKDDPTLLFSGAGMNQFKDMFMGKGTLNFSTATSAQKCLRTGDIDNVGRTAFHHTFFEMMGNFSFGDYFKRDAIRWAFEWLTEHIEIDPGRLYFSVYYDDDEAYSYWEEICKKTGYDPKKRIFRLGEHDNFWPADAPSKGPNGPCGPCSEIFFDMKYNPEDPDPVVDITEEGNRFCEIWNLVFTQFERIGVNDLKPLPQKNIDTGLGLERLAAVLQGVSTNYEIDIFLPILDRIGELFANGKKRDELDDMGLQCVKRIADHLRAVSFCISDGAMPGNAERGYVVRRLIRRAFLDASYLRGSFEYAGLEQIVPIIVRMMPTYSQLRQRELFIREILTREEKDFVKTLCSNQKRLFQAYESALDTPTGKLIPGAVAFKLFDTYGVPIEVMDDYFDRQGARVDHATFNVAIEERRNQSRSTSRMKGDIFDLGPLGKAFDLTTQTEFTGFEAPSLADMNLLMMFKGTIPVSSAREGDKVVLVFDRTPFYAESGGQVGDSGYITSENARVRIDSTTKIKKVFYHAGVIESGSIEGVSTEAYPKFSDKYFGEIAADTRKSTERNHTATHLLHWALREVLGRHCEQSGSMVDPERLRFDFTHFSSLSEEQVADIELLVNQRIMENHSLVTYEDTLENAKSSGVTALFGEKYEDRVRIVDIGGFSKELCGGCHVSSVGEIGSFIIVSEEAIASGIRRITAYTGSGAAKYSRQQMSIVSHVGNMFGSKPEEIEQRVCSLMDDNKSLRSEINKMKEKNLRDNATDAKIEDINGVPAIILDLGETEAKILRSLVDTLKSRIEGGVMLLAGHYNGSVSILVYVDDSLVSQGWKAGDLIRPAAAAVDGKGGGRPQLAQAGGKSPQKLGSAFEAFRSAVQVKTL